MFRPEHIFRRVKCHLIVVLCGQSEATWEAPPGAVIAEFSPALTSGSITQLTCLLTGSPYLSCAALSVPGRLCSWKLFAKSKCWARLQACSRENKHSQTERIVNAHTIVFLLQFLSLMRDNTSKSTNDSLPFYSRPCLSQYTFKMNIDLLQSFGSQNIFLSQSFHLFLKTQHLIASSGFVHHRVNNFWCCLRDEKCDILYIVEKERDT